MFPAARIGDLHLCPMFTGIVPHVGGPISGPCSPNVLTGKMPQARVGDIATCVGPPDAIVAGSPTVLVNNMPAARILDSCAHGGVIVLGCFTVIIGGAAGAGGGAGGAASAAAMRRAASLAIARRIVRPGGSGTAEDAELVAQQLANLPPGVLAQMEADGTVVVACRGSVTDYRSDLAGVQPRGWPAGSTWDNVPGARMGDTGEVVVATIGHNDNPPNARVPATGEGHGSANLTVHEALHGYDMGGGGHRSDDADFAAARAADTGPNTPAYEQQAGSAGQEESFAESGARYYSDPAAARQNEPNLADYWSNQP
ncbi:PAAR domain-containing protein [Roseomonas sp. PWR1]|uniref:PAAR domain-containing protein n=1 Tax=Roseomonas nitratireducens TaxID=2820810 RepID=A0ABS4AQ13_9PROT|nr:PAAR domain-containing protein [Neoroseomonas nitratireducens]MBP0463456.1 PAAR domain-containing protein [Neoroseomonas nitratireducens]